MRLLTLCASQRWPVAKDVPVSSLYSFTTATQAALLMSVSRSQTAKLAVDILRFLGALRDQQQLNEGQRRQVEALLDPLIEMSLHTCQFAQAGRLVDAVIAVAGCTLSIRQARLLATIFTEGSMVW